MTNTRILIVEDEQITVMALTLLLRSRNYDVCDPADSGTQALEIAARQRPVLALMDINITGPLDGIDTAHLLFEQHGIRSIFLSGFPRERMACRLRGREVAGYLVKPYALADLADCLAESLRV